MVLGPAGENWLLSTLILDNLNIQWGQAEAKTVAATQIVAIGAAGSMDASLLQETFASCISIPLALA